MADNNFSFSNFMKDAFSRAYAHASVPSKKTTGGRSRKNRKLRKSRKSRKLRK